MYVDDPRDRLGINTNSPSSSLHVVATESAISPLTVQNTNTSGYAQIIYSTGSATTWNVGVGGSGVGTLASKFFWYNGGTKMVLTTTGRLGVGNDSPSYPVDVNGQVSGISIYASNDIQAFSDIRVKGEIKNVKDAINKINQINGVTFIRLDAEPDNKHRHAGVIAQEVEKVFPEVVHTDFKTGLKSVAYGNLSALLIEAIKELNIKIENLEKIINKK